MNIAAGLRWNRKTLPRQLIAGKAVTGACVIYRRDTGSARALRAGFAAMIAIIGQAVCGLLAQGTT
jgi:hypothetical protein